MSMDGSTIEWKSNMLRIMSDETVGRLVQRIRNNQEELSLHAHAPLFRVSDGFKTEVSFLVDTFQRQNLNWDIIPQYLDGHKYGGDLTSLNLLERIDWLAG
ncbi:hypothetical protein K504DRAFT_516034 [Pleomassaria siparia CBS 279.74]|uniref:Uncharacterized protein n=1 Tax=Pleomassaria siparia CBS 279.74 TaxID=1314801 RepID=A0A6G1JWP4_9PLEO|nr:hypothetical protein K504DRAFT_516034 [Pleomassaria siparia CBS 279.74]